MTENTSSSLPAGIGQVITRFGAELLVESTDSDLLRCTARRKLDHIACGDHVQWEQQAQGNAAVTRILPRKNVLERPDFRGKPRAIAANIDLLVVVASWQPAPVWEMIDRYLVAAHRLSADMLLVMNKSDLRTAQTTDEHEASLQEFQQISLPILHVSAEQHEGIEQILNAIGNRTAIVVGQSGVGKSSIANCLLPDADIRVGTIAETGEGRHTTTSATLYHLPSGGSLIDSPGVRDFGLTGLDFTALIDGFPEFTPFLGECRFHNCTHNHEPGCAIKAAVNAGQIPARRFSRYLGLLAGL